LARNMLARRTIPAALKALSVCLIGQARFADAVPILVDAARLFPADAEIHNNLGIVLAGLDDLASSISSFERAYQLNPKDADITKNLAFAYSRALQWDLALPLLMEAIERCPDQDGEEVRQLANCLLGAGRNLAGRQQSNEAVVPLLKAIEHYPGDFIDAIGELAACLLNAGRLDEAWACYRELYQSDTSNMDALYQLIWVKLRRCDWSDFEGLLGRLKEGVTNLSRPIGSPFLALAFPGFSSCDHLKLAEAYAADKLRIESPASLGSLSLSRRVGEADRKLKVGYVSADFRVHPVGFAIPEIIERHDRNRVEVFGYSTGLDDGSAIRRRLMSGFDHFTDIAKLSVGEMVARIRHDDIDVLIDLQGWTAGARPALLAQRCAQVQACWLGYAGTLGDPRLVDYLIGDPVVTPQSHAAHYVESIAQLPGCFLPSDTTRQAAPAPARSAVGLPDEGFVYCSHNNPSKINPGVFDIWCRLLGQVSGSVLWLTEPGESARDNLQLQAAARGIDPGRLVFAPRFPDYSDHLARLSVADLALDTMPYNSHSSGIDVLWAGVPMVTCLGDTFANRVGASMLHATGLDELIAESSEAYFGLALELARNPVQLLQFRRRLHSSRSTSPLFDMSRFAGALEDLYAQMWQDMRAGNRKPILAP